MTEVVVEAEGVVEAGDVVGTEVDIQITKMDLITIKVFFLTQSIFFFVWRLQRLTGIDVYCFILIENGGYSNWGRGGGRGGWGYRGKHG